MSPTVNPGAAAGVVRLWRCRNPHLIERILREDYFDAPIRYFSRSLIRTVAHGWFAHSEDIYLVVAEVSGRYAGFVFGHTLGQTFWRKFTRAHLPRHALELAWIWLRGRWVPLRQALVGRLRRPPEAARRAAPPDLPRIDGPFAWSPESPDVGHVDLLFVAADFRGQGLAPSLLRHLVGEMAGHGVTLIEAHIDEFNDGSVRAFSKSGFEVYRTAGGDYYVRYRVPQRGRA